MAKRTATFYEISEVMYLPEMGECEKDIFDFILREKAATIRAIIRYASGYSQMEINQAISKLVAEGIIVRKNVSLEEGD